MGLDPNFVVQVMLRERLRVTACAAAIVRDAHTADDVFQQVVLAALERKGEFREPAHVVAWALRAARHRAVDVARKRHLRSLPDDVLDLLEAKWAESSAGGGSDLIDALHGCLGKLGGPARDLLNMRYRDGMTAVAIAYKLRRTADAVYQSLSRTHRVLRECIEREAARSVFPVPRDISP
jgi:RNA polymerase sigma-70 factor (ECF subfamily)